MNPGDIWCPDCMKYHASMTACPTRTQPPQPSGQDEAREFENETPEQFLGMTQNVCARASDAVNEIKLRDLAQRAQGRQEAAEEWCRRCGMKCKPNENEIDECMERRTILGTASKE